MKHNTPHRSFRSCSFHFLMSSEFFHSCCSQHPPVLPLPAKPSFLSPPSLFLPGYPLTRSSCFSPISAVAAWWLPPLLNLNRRFPGWKLSGTTYSPSDQVPTPRLSPQRPPVVWAPPASPALPRVALQPNKAGHPALRPTSFPPSFCLSCSTVRHVLFIVTCQGLSFFRVSDTVSHVTTTLVVHRDRPGRARSVLWIFSDGPDVLDACWSFVSPPMACSLLWKWTHCALFVSSTETRE